jgi:hypothetical protein
MSFEDDIKSRKELAKAKRRKAYQEAKSRKLQYQKDMREKIESGEMEAPTSWLEAEKRKEELRQRAKDYRKKQYQQQKQRKLQEKEAAKEASPKDDLTQQIIKASELLRLQQQAKEGNHLRVVKLDDDKGQ